MVSHVHKSFCRLNIHCEQHSLAYSWGTMASSAAALSLTALSALRGNRFAMPPRALSREEVRRVDERAINDLGLPGVVLMENAALGLTDVVCAELAERGAGPGAIVGIVTGKGNNGGDGFVLARHLALRGFEARVAYCGDRAAAKRETDAGINLTVLERAKMGTVVDVADGAALSSLLAEWSDATLLVDAVSRRAMPTMAALPAAHAPVSAAGVRHGPERAAPSGGGGDHRGAQCRPTAKDRRRSAQRPRH